MRIRIDREARCFMRGEKPFFYQGDTLWMAFSKLSLEEWEEILRLRRLQRFTVLQISMLPISHDNSEDEDAPAPFLRDEKGGWDFSSINTAYFDHACAMLEMAVAYGFVPCLHLLWANYIPDTWAALRSPGTVMPPEAQEAYLRYCIPRVAAYAPLYSISGDTSFETPRVSDCYQRAIEVVRALDPDGLITLHLQPHAEVPPALAGLLDFFSYQDGHGYTPEEQLNSVHFAQYYWNRSERLPVVNTEPPYDGHGFGHEYGRFRAFEVRKSLWQGLLSGAHAGISYGAHGLWSMHREGQHFNNAAFSGAPFDWRDALRLEGAWECGWIHTLFAQYSLHDLQPLEGVETHPEQIRMAGKRDGSLLLLYAPYPAEIALHRSLEGYSLLALALEQRRWLTPRSVQEGGKTLLPLLPVNSDVLYIAERK